MIDLNHSRNLAVRPRAGCFRILFLHALTMAGLGFTTAGRVTAQTYINSDGANPYAGLVLLSDTLYGTATAGGIEGNGTVFAIHTDGTGFTNLHSLTYSDGVGPSGGFSLSGNTLYGTADAGGGSGNGTRFAINTNGTVFTNPYSFSYSDGAKPNGLVVSSNTLYGTTYGYGSFGSSANGTIFALNTDGTGFTNLYSFTPLFIPPPHLTVMISGTNVVLTWPTNYYGVGGIYFPISTTNLVSPAGWTLAFASSPVVVNGQNTVTNSIIGTQQFYSLTRGCFSDLDCGNPCFACSPNGRFGGTCERRCR